MNTLPLRASFLHIAALMLSLINYASGQAVKKEDSSPPVRVVGPGLTLWRFPVHPSQVTATSYTGYVKHEELGKPLKAPRTVNSISKWAKAEEENAALVGYIKIDQPGAYGFRTDSDYDRNELIVDGNIVCKFRDGANQGQVVQLRSGMLPIISVAYFKTTTDVRVQWMPPGQKTWSDIPNKLLSHAEPDPQKPFPPTPP